MELLIMIITWLILSFVAGHIAGKKNRSPFGYFLLSLLVSPIISIIVASLVSPKTNVKAF